MKQEALERAAKNAVSRAIAPIIANNDSMITKSCDAAELAYFMNDLEQPSDNRPERTCS
jgi:hypothetical protein